MSVSHKASRDELETLATAVVTGFEQGKNFDEIVAQNCATEHKQLQAIVYMAVLKILHGASINQKEMRTTLARLENSVHLNTNDTHVNALTALLENSNVANALELHTTAHIKISDLRRGNRCKYAEFAVVTNNDELFMDIFGYEVSVVDESMPCCMDNVISLIYIYVRARPDDTAEFLWDILKRKLPQHLIEAPYATFIRKVHKNPSFMISHANERYAEHPDEKNFLFLRSELRQAAKWPELYALLVSNEHFLFTEEGANMGLLAHDAQSLYDGGEHDLAFSLWCTIIEKNPEHQKAAYNFAVRNKSKSKVRNKLLATKKSEKKVKTHVSHLPDEIRALSVTISNQVNSVENWFAVADRFAQQANVDVAVEILFSIMSQYTSCTSICIVKISNWILHSDLNEAMIILNIPTRLSKNPNLIGVFNSIASRQLQKGREEFADAIYATSSQCVQNPSSTSSKAHALLKINRIAEAVELMKQDIQKYPKIVFAFILELLSKKLFNACLELYTAFQVYHTNFALPFAYSMLIQVNSESFRTRVLQLLLPETKGVSMQEDDCKLLLFIFDYVNWDTQKKLCYIDELVTNRALSDEVANTLRTRANVAYIADKIAERDAELEAYVEVQMPTLKTSKFFASISNTHILENPGKRTSRMARSVLVRPERMSSNATEPGPKKRKK